jgi:hypothetical protein
VDDTERRDLRMQAISAAAYIHGDANVVFEREEQTNEVIKTAQQFYDWVVENDETPTATGVVEGATHAHREWIEFTRGLRNQDHRKL